MTEILLIDDERVMRDAFRRLLEGEGFAVRTASDGRQGLAAFSERRPDLVLLDVMMPTMNGYETAAEMRKLDRETPILFLSALDSDDDQVRGLEVGADDYVAKTASASLLLARIRKALVRADRFSTADAPESMTRTEADIYRLLDSDRGAYFGYRRIFEAICGDGYVADEGAVRVHVSNMRKKLPHGERIVAKRGFGYALASTTTSALRRGLICFAVGVSVALSAGGAKADEPFVPSEAYLRRLRDELRGHGVGFTAIPYQGGDSPEVYHKLVEIGVDGLCTDFPKVLFASGVLAPKPADAQRHRAP